MTPRNIIWLSSCVATLAGCQPDEGLVLWGSGLPLADGTEIDLTYSTDTNLYVQIGHTIVRDGKFELRSKVTKPEVGMLTTNNLSIVQQNKWPDDSIHWNYVDLVVANEQTQLLPDMTIRGGQVQVEFDELQKAGGAYASADVKLSFIANHPHSSVSYWLALGLLKRAYSLSADEVDLIYNTLSVESDDPVRFAELRRREQTSRQTTRLCPLRPMHIKTIDGREALLSDVLPSGKYVLVDFWASWCGICLSQMPEVEKVLALHSDSLAVVSVSIDDDAEAWQKAMTKHPHTWSQYIATAEGRQDLAEGYNVGNGVPYYLLVDPQGRVVAQPDSPSDIATLQLTVNN